MTRSAVFFCLDQPMILTPVTINLPGAALPADRAPRRISSAHRRGQQPQRHSNIARMTE